MLASLAAAIEDNPHARRKTSRRGRLVLFALAALAAASLAWLAGTFVARAALERRANGALERLVETQPLLQSFPLRLGFDHGNRAITVSGIEPSQVDIGSLVDALAKAAAPYQIVDRIGVVPGLEQSAALRADIAAAQQSLSRMQAGIDEMRGEAAEEAGAISRQYADLGSQYAALEAALRADISALQQSLSRLQTGIDETRGEVVAESSSRNSQFAGLGSQYAALQSIVDGPDERLGRFMTSTAIFFGDDDEFADGEEADRQLHQFAALLSKSNMRVRIVGHADDSGSESGNKVIARKRAERVREVVASLGIAPLRLLVVSRSSSMPISYRTGPTGNGNRRVTFETVFQTEPAQ
jgi:outer membrane protein OmpA-like peptidoglycan-associated protein